LSAYSAIIDFLPLLVVPRADQLAPNLLKLFAAIIDPMRFTYDPPPPSARPCNTLQVYSVMVAATRGDLQLPLDVFGMVAIRDSVDRNRNLVFYRTRDDCQTLTEKVCL
jgi:hypothetical protein